MYSRVKICNVGAWFGVKLGGIGSPKELVGGVIDSYFQRLAAVAKEPRRQSVANETNPLAYLKGLPESKLRQERRSLARARRDVLAKDESGWTDADRLVLEKVKECDRLWKLLCS